MQKMKKNKEGSEEVKEETGRKEGKREGEGEEVQIQVSSAYHFQKSSPLQGCSACILGSSEC